MAMTDQVSGDDPVVAQVRDTVLRLLSEERYEHLSLGELVAGSGVSENEIYRRWASKPDLLVAIIRASLSNLTVPDSGDLREDLVEFTRNWQAKANGELWPLLHAMISRIHRSRDVAVAYQAVSLYLEDSLGTIMRRGIAQGRIRADAPTTLAIEILRARVWYRYIRNWPLDPDVAAETVDRVVLPVLEHG